MKTFTIDCDNNITAFASLEEAKAADIAGAEYFSSEEELAHLAASWPVAGARGRGSSKLIELWNSLPGVTPVKKFTDRQTALARIWKAAQALTPPGAPQGAPDAPKAKGSRKKATSAKRAAPARKGGKKAQILELLRQAEGATLKDIMSATGWQAHSVRGFISGSLVKKMDLKVESFKTPQGDRAYRVS